MAQVLGKKWMMELGGAGGAVITGQNNLSLNVSLETIESTTKDSTDSWKTFQPGFKTATAEIEGNYDDSATGNQDSELFDKLTAGTSVNLDLTDETSDYNGDFYVTEFSISGERGAMTTFSASLQLDGELSKSTHD